MMRKARQETALCGWVEALPDDLVRRRPVLNVTFAGALLASGVLNGRRRSAGRRRAPGDVTGRDRGGVLDARGWGCLCRRGRAPPTSQDRSRCTGPPWHRLGAT
jgi:hypothetical protein